MTEHVHYDIEDIERRAAAAIDSQLELGLAEATSDSARRHLLAQRRFHHVYLAVMVETLKLSNEGVEDGIVLDAIAVAFAGHMKTCSENFGPAFAALVTDKVSKIARGDLCSGATVTVDPVQGGRA